MDRPLLQRRLQTELRPQYELQGQPRRRSPALWRALIYCCPPSTADRQEPGRADADAVPCRAVPCRAPSCWSPDRWHVVAVARAVTVRWRRIRDMDLCSRCARPCRGAKPHGVVCASCERAMVIEDRDHADHTRWGGDLDLRLTLEDLRPEVRAALEHLTANEGAAVLPDSLHSGVWVTWDRSMFDAPAWDTAPQRASRRISESKGGALDEHLQNLWDLWHATPNPKPKPTASWIEDELAMRALAGDTRTQRGWRLLRRFPPRPRPVCAQCGARFDTKRRHARTCSPACRQAHSRSQRQGPVPGDR